MAVRSRGVFPQAIKVALEKDGGVLLASAIQSRDATFVNRVVNIVGDAVRQCQHHPHGACTDFRRLI